MRFTKYVCALVICALMISFAPVVHADAGYYDAIQAKIGVGGTGTFVISELIGEGADEHIGDVISSIEVKDYGEFTLSYDEPGAYKYLISSSDKYNTARYRVIVTVTAGEDMASDMLSQSITIMPENENRKVTIAYYPVVVVDPPIKKVVKGDGAPKDTVFDFDFKAVDTSVEELKGKMPMPEGSDGQVKHLRVKTGEEVEAGSFYLPKAGTYKYEFVEKNTAIKDYTYDESVWRVEFTVTEGEKGYDVVKTIYKNGEKTDAAKIEFVNTYRGEPGKGPIKTGDVQKLALWVGLFAVSVGGGMFAVVGMKKKKREES